MGSPGTRRMSSQSPPRLVISPAHGLNGEEPPVIEENEEEQEEISQNRVTKEDSTIKPATLQLNDSEKIDVNDANSPTSETTLVHEGEPDDGEVAEKTGEGEEAAAVTITV